MTEINGIWTPNILIHSHKNISWRSAATVQMTAQKTILTVF